ALDPLLRRFVVELVARAAARAAAAGTHAATPTRRDVANRGARPLAGLAGPRPFLVDRAGGDLLRTRLRTALPALGLLDMLVLASALGPLLHSTRWHGFSLRRFPPSYPRVAGTNELRSRRRTRASANSRRAGGQASPTRGSTRWRRGAVGLSPPRRSSIRWLTDSPTRA